MGNDDRPNEWVEQIGNKVPVNDDVDKQHGRTLGKLESAASSRQTEVPNTELEEDKYKGLDKEGEHKNVKDVKNAQPEYDHDGHKKNLAEVEVEREGRAIKDYENRTSKVRIPEPDIGDKNLLNRVNGIADRTTSYIDDISRNLGRIGPIVGRAAGIIGFFYPEPVADATLYGENPEWAEKGHIPVDLTIENNPKQDILIENESPPSDIPIHSFPNEETIDLTEIPEVQDLFNQLDEFTKDEDSLNAPGSFDLDQVDYEDQGDGIDMDFD